jgi:hypothetical protein
VGHYDPCGIRSAPGAQRRRLDPARQLHYRGPGDVHLRRRLQRAVQPPGRSTWGALLSVPTGSGCSASAPSSPTPWAATHPGPPIGSSPTAAPAPPCTTCSRVRLGDGGGPRLRCRWPPRCGRRPPWPVRTLGCRVRRRAATPQHRAQLPRGGRDIKVDDPQAVSATAERYREGCMCKGTGLVGHVGSTRWETTVSTSMEDVPSSVETSVAAPMIIRPLPPPPPDPRMDW